MTISALVANVAAQIGRLGALSQRELAVAWLHLGATQLRLAVRFDALAVLVGAVVAVVSLVVTMYATSYMRGDARYTRFFTVFGVFIAAMLTLVVADDLILLFAMWELIGACSYLLIGFWFDRDGVPPAATRALVVTRLGDLALLAGLLLLIRAVGSADLHQAVATGRQLAPAQLGVIAALVVTGALAKSAQLPFSAWLPDAMRGPTPVSALLHSATMVAAGAYLVARLFPVFEASGILPWVAWIGAATALYGALCALAQDDLKRLLAYSTMSQLGFMFVGLGAGSITAGIALLIAQAFFKSLLFLATGNVSRATGSTLFSAMGGLARAMPLTFVLFALGTAALAGIPVSLALPAKDLVFAAASGVSMLLFLLVSLASLLTALYAGRALTLAFLSPRAGDAGAREAGRRMREGGETPALMRGATIIAGTLVVIGGMLSSPLIADPIARMLRSPASESAIATTVALLLALLGMAAALFIYRDGDAANSAPLARVARAGFGLPVLYSWIQRGMIALSRAASTADVLIFDSIAGGLATAARSAARQLAAGDRGVFDAGSDRIAAGTIALVNAARGFDLSRVNAAIDAGARSFGTLGQQIRSVQTGRIDNYLLATFVWGLGALALATVIAVIHNVA